MDTVSPGLPRLHVGLGWKVRYGFALGGVGLSGLVTGRCPLQLQLGFTSPETYDFGVMMNQPMFRLTAAFFALIFVGCGDSGRLPTCKTTGSVTYVDGESVQEGSVIFVAEGVPAGRAVIDDGEYSIGTYEDDDGAVAAKFRVSVNVHPPEDFDPDGRKRPPKLAHEKYSAPDTSGLEFEVTKDGDNRFDIVLEREK